MILANPILQIRLRLFFSFFSSCLSVSLSLRVSLCGSDEQWSFGLHHQAGSMLSIDASPSPSLSERGQSSLVSLVYRVKHTVLCTGRLFAHRSVFTVQHLLLIGVRTGGEC